MVLAKPDPPRVGVRYDELGQFDCHSAFDRGARVELRRPCAEWIERPEEPVPADRSLARNTNLHCESEALPGTDRMCGPAVELVDLDLPARRELLGVGRAAIESRRRAQDVS